MEPQAPIAPESQPVEPSALPPEPAPQPVQTPSPIVEAPMTSKPPSKLKMPIIIVIVLLVIGGVAAGYLLMKNKTSAKNGTTQTKKTTGGEAKADKVIEILKATPKDSNSFIQSEGMQQLSQEVDKYAKITEKPNLTKDERLTEATSIGVSLGLYSSTIRDGQVKKLSSQASSGNDKVVVTKYSVENPSSKALKGPYEVVVTTAYLDGDWRLVDFTVSPI